MNIDQNYKNAKEQYAEKGVDTAKVIQALKKVPLSLHCWQTDDVGGFEKPGAELGGGGIAVTGNYPGKARSLDEMRGDLEKVYSLIPGTHRLALHASYGDFGGKLIERDAIEPKHFDSWLAWGRKNKVKLDFNCTVFSHPLSDDGFSLSSKNAKNRKFWIEHTKRARKISAYIGNKQKSSCIHNIWLHDGMKDIPADRMGYRKILMESLDEIFKVKYPEAEMKDALESKLFGIGSEAFVVGSHEFYMGYTLTRNKMICLDMGHFHPTESVPDKVSSVLLFAKELLLHVSRPIRWDSDHIVVLDDPLQALFIELVRSSRLNDVHIGLDFFDGTLNRVGAYAIGARASLKALLYALLEPRKLLIDAEKKGDYFSRLALMEELKSMPFGAVWNYYCAEMNAPLEKEIVPAVKNYENTVLSKRL
jgi:L-rhamnose isomerase